MTASFRYGEKLTQRRGSIYFVLDIPSITYRRYYVQGCDASVIIASTANNTAEKDHPDNLSLAGDGFDTVIKAKEAVDAVARCTNKVSCADILAMATRDVVALVCNDILRPLIS